jgi:enoyl-CoA hydratase
MIRTEARGPSVVLTMDDGKANAIDAAFLEEIERALDANPGKPLLLTGTGKIFSAGLHLPTLAPLGRPEMEGFLDRFHRTFIRLFTWPAPLVAAINGHAIAGGCILALMADARIMADGPFTIGVNEAQLGLSLPSVAANAVRFHVPASRLVSVVYEGRLFSPSEAAASGLVDEICPQGELWQRAADRLDRMTAIPPAAFSEIKAEARGPAVERIRAESPENSKRWLDLWFSEESRRRVSEVVAKLSGRK